MKKHPILLIVAAIVGLSQPVAHAASGRLAYYDSEANKIPSTLDDTYVNGEFTFSPSFFTGVTTGWASGGANAFARATNPSGSGSLPNMARGTGDSAVDQAAAVDFGSYFEFSIAPASGETLNLTQVTARIQGDAGSGAEAFTITAFLRSSLDDYTATLAAVSPEQVPAVASGGGTVVRFTTLDTEELSSSFTGLTESVTFRLYVYITTETASFNQLVRIDNVAIWGSTGAIPEPHAAAFLVGLIACAAAGLRRHRR